jgi:hypothetical protein
VTLGLVVLVLVGSPVLEGCVANEPGNVMKSFIDIISGNRHVVITIYVNDVANEYGNVM